MRQYILISLLMCVVASSLAQGTISRQVDVTRDYTPDVDKASKKDIPATMYDTVRLNPEIRYSIAPSALQGAVKRDTIAAVGIATNAFSPGTPLFVRLGAGYPLNSVADIYYSKIYENGNNFGGYVNHDGYWGKLKNDMAVKLGATDYSLNVGAFGRVKVASRYNFQGDVNFDMRGVDKYGLFAIEDIPLDDYGTSTRASWRNMGVNLCFGDDFKNLSRLSFRVMAGADLLADNSNNDEFSYNIAAQLGKAFGRNVVTVKAKWLATSDTKPVTDKYRDNILTISPRYERQGDKYDFGVGADVTINDGKVWVFPYAKLSWNIAQGAFVPYIEARGELTQNSYSANLARNPYIQAALVMPNSASYVALAGVSGNINAKFSYKAYAGFDIQKHTNWFTNLYFEGMTNEFGYVTQGVTMLKIGGNIDWFASPSLRAELGVDYLGVVFTDVPAAFSLPNLTSKIKVSYNFLSRFDIALKGCFQTPRKFFAMSTLFDGLRESKTSSTFDLGISAKWQMNEQVGIFLDATNILGAKLYPYGHYVGRGAMMRAGVMLNF